MPMRRTIESVFSPSPAIADVLLLIGAPGVGKTTTLKTCARAAKRRYLSLKKEKYRTLAQQDPRAFLRRFRPPIALDDIHLVPELLPILKTRLTNRFKKGSYWLSMTAAGAARTGVAELLGEKVAVLRLEPLSLPEITQQPFYEPFLPVRSWINARQREALYMDSETFYAHMARGFFPTAVTKTDRARARFFNTFLKNLFATHFKNSPVLKTEKQFFALMKALALKSGRTLNYSDVHRATNQSVETLQSWVALLQKTGVLRLLHPYQSDLPALKEKATKMPKLYFCDTGLLCHLLKCPTGEKLEKSRFADAVFETFVVNEIFKSHVHNGRTPEIWFYRDNEHRLVSLLMKENGQLYPVEIKMTARAVKNDVSDVALLQKWGLKLQDGAVACLVRTHLPVTAQITQFPAWFL